MKDKVYKILSHRTIIVILYVLLAMGASTQSLLLSPKTNQEEVIEYTKYNNYIIFSQSYHHLKNNQDLYIAYPDEHWDLFKYTPTFSVFFGFFTLFPDWLGLNLWNLLNALVFLSAIYYLPRLNNTQKGWLLLIVLGMFAFGFAQIQLYGLFCKAVGVNSLSSRQKVADYSNLINNNN